MKKLIALMLALLAAWPACALAEKENADLFAEALSENCHVQEGHFEHMDTIALASQGKLISCFGNNAGSGYLVPMIPPAPNQEPAPATEMGQMTWPAEEPSAWYTQAYIQSEGYTDFSVVQAGQGQALHIANYMANDARIAQDVAVEPNSFYCLSGQICAQAQGGRGANLSIADVYAFSAGIYDSQGEWRQVELYGQTGPRQRSLTVYARLGGYSGETSGEAWFTNLSLKKVESLPAGVEVTLFYQPSYSAETKTFSLDLRHLLLAVLVLLYGLMACQCYCFKSVLGLLMLSLGVAALSLLCRGASDTQQTQNAMPYVPYIVYGLLLATLAIALFLAHRLARRGEAVPFFCGRQAQTPPAGVFMQDEQANHQRSRRADAKDAALMLGITVLYALLAYYHLGSTVSPQTSFIFRQASETVVFDL